MNKKLALCFVVAILAISSLACGSSSSTPQKVGDATSNSSTNSSGPTATTVKIQTYKIGDIIKIGDLTVTVNSTSTPKATDVFEPDTGKEFFVVDVTIENTGSSSQDISSLAQMSLKDNTSQVYQEDFLAESAGGGKSPNGEIAAGEKIRGQVGFQIPTDSTGLQFVFDGSIFGSGKVFIDLGK